MHQTSCKPVHKTRGHPADAGDMSGKPISLKLKRWDSTCAGINALLASPALKRADLCYLMSLKQLVLQDPEQRLALLYVVGCKMLTSLRVLSPALTTLAATGCHRLQANSSHACKHAASHIASARTAICTLFDILLVSALIVLYSFTQVQKQQPIFSTSSCRTCIWTQRRCNRCSLKGVQHSAGLHGQHCCSLAVLSLKR
jgi:hypothetical protein